MRFYANPSTRTEFGNGAVGFGPGGPFDCLGPYARVQNCPIHGTDVRATCYATGYADTFFSVPAYTRVKGRYIGGYLTITHTESNDGTWTSGIGFCPYTKYLDRL